MPNTQMWQREPKMNNKHSIYNTDGGYLFSLAVPEFSIIKSYIIIEKSKSTDKGDKSEM